MDLATIVGFIMVNGLVLSAMAMTNVGIAGYIDIPSVLITIGGAAAGVIISYPLDKLKSTVAITKNVLFVKNESPVVIVNSIVKLAEKARKEGILALENEASQLKNDFLKQGLQLAIDGTEGELIKDILTTEITFIEERHSSSAAIFDNLGILAPAFGMVGTLVGLIAMLAAMDDPSTIGPNMSIALITTLYGSMVANMIALPVSNKLKYYSAKEIILKELMLEGIMSIQAGDNPRLIQKKLLSFLDSKSRIVSEGK